MGSKTPKRDSDLGSWAGHGEFADISALKDPSTYLDSLILVKMARIVETAQRIRPSLYGDKYDLKRTDLRILVNIAYSGPISISELSRRIHVDKAWVSRSLPALEARGLISRAVSATDPRAAEVSLTDRGRAILQQISPVLKRNQEAVLKGIESGEAHAIVDRMLRNVLAYEKELKDEKT